MASKYVVTGEYVTLRTQGVGGPTLVGYYKGALVPEDVPQESIDHHLSRGLIAEVGKGEEPPAPTDEHSEPRRPAKR